MTHSARSLSQSDRPAGPVAAGLRDSPAFAPSADQAAPALLAVINKVPVREPGRDRHRPAAGRPGRGSPRPGHRATGPPGPSSPLPPGKGALASRSRAASGPLQRSLPQSASGKPAIAHQYANPGERPLTLPGDNAAPRRYPVSRIGYSSLGRPGPDSVASIDFPGIEASHEPDWNIAACHDSAGS